VTARSPELTAWLRDFAVSASSPVLVEAFVQRIDGGILARVPEVKADPLLVEDLHASTRAHWKAILQTMTADDAGFVFAPPAEDFVRSVVRRRHDIGVALRVYRAGNLAVWDYFTELTEDLPADGPTRDETLVHLWTRAGAWIDASIDRVTEIYYAERSRALESQIAGKIESIDALLAGLPVSEDASGKLGHALSHCQTAFVVWMPAWHSEAIRAMQDAAASLASALGAPRPLTIPRSTRDLWCWAATPARPEISAALASFEQVVPADVRVAVGSPAPGMAGFRTSNEQARDAQRLAMSAPEAPSVVRYDEVELLCLANTDSDAFRRMVRRELGDLAGGAAGVAPIRHTLFCYLTSAANVDTAAARLHVHRNTVRYRLNRAEELIGHPVAERVGHVELALRYVELFGVPEAPADLTRAAPKRRSRAAPASVGATRTG
jgi:hypothetical protein